MATKAAITLVLIIASTLISMSCADSGLATYYDTYVPSSCYGNDAKGTMIAAASPAMFNNRGACGTHYKIKCTGATNQGVLHPCKDRDVTVMVVDLCPHCPPGQFDLSKEAFVAIADTDAGKILIDYTKAN